MQINNLAGIVHDSISYITTYFNLEKVHTFIKPFAKNEDDILEHYYAFRKIYKIDPPENLYLFSFFDGKNPALIIAYLDKNFPNLDYTPQSVLKLFEDKDKFRKFAYHYFLEPFKNEVNIEAIIKGDIRNTALAAALLAAEHNNYPMLAHKLFYYFDILVDELIDYLKLIFHKVTLYHNNNKNILKTTIDDFINSDHANVISKSFYPGKSMNFSIQTYAVSLFRRFGIKGSPLKNGRVTLIIGDICTSSSPIYTDYKYITEESASFIFTTPIMRDIIDILKKGEKTITQLSTMIPYSRSNITKFILMLKEELAIKVSRKDGKDVYYTINFPYFKAAKIVLSRACDDILRSET